VSDEEPEWILRDSKAKRDCLRYFINLGVCVCVCVSLKGFFILEIWRSEVEVWRKEGVEVTK